MRLRRHHKKQKNRHRKHQAFVRRKLNELHLFVYYAIALPLLFAFFYLIDVNIAGFAKYLLLGLAFFLYTMCKFPIVQGTRGDSTADPAYDFLSEAVLYGSAITLMMAFLASLWYFRTTDGPGHSIPGLSPWELSRWH